MKSHRVIFFYLEEIYLRGKRY